MHVGGATKAHIRTPLGTPAKVASSLTGSTSIEIEEISDTPTCGVCEEKPPTMWCKVSSFTHSLVPIRGHSRLVDGL
jgi:hypothetical protein